MALILVDGFDLYNGTGTGTGLQTKWTRTAFDSPSMVPGRFDGQAVQWGSTSLAGGLGARTLPSSYSALGVGVAYRCLSFPTVSTPFAMIAFRSSGTYQVGLKVNPSGGLDVCRLTGATAGAILGSTPNSVITPGTWHFIEFEFTISDTAGTASVKVDGVTRLTLTGQDTRNGAPTTVNEIYCGPGGFGPNYGMHQIDDAYITDGATLGERRIETLRPASDALVQWSPSTGVDNYAMVNDETANAANFVSASNVGGRDLYTTTGLSSAPTSIDAVQVTSFALKTDATTRALYNSVQSGGVNSDGSIFALAATYQKFDRLLERNPDGNAGWTPAAVNSLLIGPKVAA